MMARSIYISFVLAVLALGLQACGPKLPQAEEACGHAQNSYGQRVSWKSQVPITLYLDDTSVPEEYHSAIQRAMDQWTRQAGRQLFRYGGVISQNPRPAQDGVSMIYWLKEWDENRPLEEGRTNIYWVGPTIHEADILINAKNFTYYDRTPKAGAIHLESLMVHELGHVLGLAHREGASSRDSVMGLYLAKNETRTELGTADLEALRCEYL